MFRFLKGADIFWFCHVLLPSISLANTFLNYPPLIKDPSIPLCLIYSKQDLPLLKKKLFPEASPAQVTENSQTQEKPETNDPGAQTSGSNLEGQLDDQTWLLQVTQKCCLNYTVLEPKQLEKKNWEKFYCEICKKTLNGATEWDAHLKSNTHKKRKSSFLKKQKNQNPNIKK